MWQKYHKNCDTQIFENTLKIEHVLHSWYHKEIQMTVLLADDSPLIRTQLKELIALSRQDLLLYCSTDVETTIQSLQQYEVNVLILDLQFPDGSGFSVLEFIKGQEKRPFVMVLTNLASKGVRYKSLQLGADLFFDKTEEYERVVEEIVRLHDI